MQTNNLTKAQKLLICAVLNKTAVQNSNAVCATLQNLRYFKAAAVKQALQQCSAQLTKRYAAVAQRAINNVRD
jgi:hypothetical protein